VSVSQKDRRSLGSSVLFPDSMCDPRSRPQLQHAQLALYPFPFVDTKVLQCSSFVSGELLSHQVQNSPGRTLLLPPAQEFLELFISLPIRLRPLQVVCAFSASPGLSSTGQGEAGSEQL
jgi:hypothetical protein